MKHFHTAPNGFVKIDSTRTKVYESFTVQVWQQPFWRWLIATVYHWYDSHIYKVPGFMQLERALAWFHRNEPLEYIPLGCKQDIRCYHLDNKQRKVLAEFKVKADSEIVKASWPE